MRKLAVGLSLVVELGVASRLIAHEGHAHKVMGTVLAIDATSLEIEAKDAKETKKLKLVLTAATKFLKAKTPAAAADVKVGQRVVVTYAEEAGVKKVQEVALGVVEKPEPGRGKD